MCNGWCVYLPWFTRIHSGAPRTIGPISINIPIQLSLAKLYMARKKSTLWKVEESKKKQLNKALAKGEKSGFLKNFDPEFHLRLIHTKRK